MKIMMAVSPNVPFAPRTGMLTFPAPLAAD